MKVFNICYSVGCSVDVLPRLFLWFSQAKHFECPNISPPTRGTVCVHMYSVAWDVLVNHYLTETVWRENCVEGAVWRTCVVGSYMGELCLRSCVWGAVRHDVNILRVLFLFSL